MTILRTIGAIVAGYFVYAFASMLLVGIVQSSSEVTAIVFGLFGLALTALLSGFMTAYISREKKRTAVSVVSGLVLIATTANLILQLGAEPLWYKVGTLLITVPGILLLGFITRKQQSNSEAT